MTTCTEVEGRLDLYAAGECDPHANKAIAAHLAQCGACRERLAEARRLMGLLDLHYRSEPALDRLLDRLAEEARPAPRLRWRSAHARQLLAAAALFLVLGLGLWNLPGPAPSLQADLALVPQRRELEKVPDLPEMAIFPARGQPEISLDLEGRTLAQVREALAKAGPPPLPPRVNLALALRNSEPYPLVVRPGSAEVQLDLHGGKVVRVKVARTLPEGRPRTIPPGGKLLLPLPRLIERSQAQEEYLYPLEPGEYTLRVRLWLLAWRAGVPEPPRRLSLSAGPVTVRLPRSGQ